MSLLTLNITNSYFYYIYIYIYIYMSNKRYKQIKIRKQAKIVWETFEIKNSFFLFFFY